MAKVVAPLFSNEARGSVGSTTYTTLRGKSIAKTRAGSGVYQTAGQIEVRAITAAMTAQWKALTQLQRDAWNTYASQHLLPDWTGSSKRLSGYNWFIKLSVPYSMYIGDPPLVPPLGAGPGYPLNLRVTLSGSDYYLESDDSPSEDGQLYVVDIWFSPWGSVAAKPDQHYSKHYATSVAPAYCILPATALESARIGCWVRLIAYGAGLIYPWEFCDFTK